METKFSFLGCLTAMYYLLNAVRVLSANSLPVKFSWSSVELKYDDADLMENDIRNGVYNPFNITILDSDFYDSKYYVTTPSLLAGSPATLCTVTDELDSNGAYLLKPFPDWSWHNSKNCDRIISPFRIKIDILGRMWVVDSGALKAFTDDLESPCPPKVLAFDLKNNNSLVARKTIPSSLLTNDSLLINLDVQIMKKNGSDTVIYIADVSGRMIVCRIPDKGCHAVVHPYFNFDPNYEHFSMNGVSFDLTDGLFNIAIDFSKDVVYFHSLSSGNTYYVPASVLRKPTPLTEEDMDQFKILPYKKKMHTSSAVLTKKGVLIFATLENNALYAWNSKQSYEPRHFKKIAQNNITLQFPSGMKKIGSALLVTTSRLQNVIAYNRNDYGVKNFRVLQGKITALGIE